MDDVWTNSRITWSVYGCCSSSVMKDWLYEIIREKNNTLIFFCSLNCLKSFISSPQNASMLAISCFVVNISSPRLISWIWGPIITQIRFLLHLTFYNAGYKLSSTFSLINFSLCSYLFGFNEVLCYSKEGPFYPFLFFLNAFCTCLWTMPDVCVLNLVIFLEQHHLISSEKAFNLPYRAWKRYKSSF